MNYSVTVDSKYHTFCIVSVVVDSAAVGVTSYNNLVEFLPRAFGDSVNKYGRRLFYQFSIYLSLIVCLYLVCLYATLLCI